MKKLKISLLGVFAVIIGLMASSFSVITTPKFESSVWFTYDGTGPKDDVTSYSLNGDDPQCDNTEDLCAIKIEEGENSRPDSAALQSLYSSSNGMSAPQSGVIEFGDLP